MGGILFIDEAYALAPLKGDNDYGQEAVNTLIKAMEDNRTNFVVIAAGYTNEMERFLNSNPGLKSRFNEYILFEDYSADQLVEIFLRLLEQNDYYLDNADGQLEPAVRQYFIGLYQNSDRDQFGNAREARNIFEKIVRAHGGRVAHIENPTREDLMAITWDDLIGTMFEKPDSE